MRRWWPPVAFMVLISALSSTVIGPRQFVRSVSKHSPLEVSEAGFASFWQEWWWVFVKGFHVLEFAALTLLLLRALPSRSYVAVLVAAGFSVVDEYHQTFVPARGGRLADVAIDLIGVLGAWVLWKVWVAAKVRRRPPDAIGTAVEEVV